MGHSDNELWEEFIRMRGVNEFSKCGCCQGLGVRLYGSTSTWHGGIGGSAMTLDVCDACWGSGNKDYSWPSHRKYYSMERRLKSDS